MGYSSRTELTISDMLPSHTNYSNFRVMQKSYRKNKIPLRRAIIFLDSPAKTFSSVVSSILTECTAADYTELDKYMAVIKKNVLSHSMR